MVFLNPTCTFHFNHCHLGGEVWYDMIWITHDWSKPIFCYPVVQFITDPMKFHFASKEWKLWLGLMVVLECVHAWRSLLPLHTKGNLTDYKIICHLSPFSGLQKWFYYLLELTIMLPFTTTSLTTSVAWFSLGRFSCSFVSDSLWPHRL